MIKLIISITNRFQTVLTDFFKPFQPNSNDLETIKTDVCRYLDYESSRLSWGGREGGSGGKAYLRGRILFLMIAEHVTMQKGINDGLSISMSADAFLS